MNDCKHTKECNPLRNCANCKEYEPIDPKQPPKDLLDKMNLAPTIK